MLVPCEECHGKRYNRETLEVRFRGKSIADILDMTINMAVEFFENIPSILSKVKVLQDVGLGYIKLGQPSTTLSGGESQRVKLATELAKKDTGKTLYVLDEPTTGLHFEDIRVLLGVLNKLVDKGNTIIVIEHNLDVIKCADYLIDMGPEGGRGGGQVLAAGTPEEVAESKKGYTPKFIKEELEKQGIRADVLREDVARVVLVLHDRRRVGARRIGDVEQQSDREEDQHDGQAQYLRIDQRHARLLHRFAGQLPLHEFVVGRKTGRT